MVVVENIRNRNLRMYFHCVLNPKILEKIRAAFDAAAKIKNISLNDHLVKGADLLNKLVPVSNHFVMGKNPVTADTEQMFDQIKLKHSHQHAPSAGKYAFTTDIEQMVHQIKGKNFDQDAVRFLWRTTKI